MHKKTIVIKIGTQVLTTPTGILDLNSLRSLSHQMAAIKKKYSLNIILVSSGAITCGSEQMSLKAKTMPEKQATAAVGQILLIQQYFHFFQERGVQIAQILLTRDGIENPERKQNAINTLNTLLAQSITPIINENDTVSTQEIAFGDNDELASDVAIMMQAKQLILLTNTDGLYTSNPNKDTSAKLINSIKYNDYHIDRLVDDLPNTPGRGGMLSKLNAARAAAAKGIDVFINNGRRESIICDIVSEKSIGTIIKGK